MKYWKCVLLARGKVDLTIWPMGNVACVISTWIYVGVFSLPSLINVKNWWSVDKNDGWNIWMVFILFVNLSLHALSIEKKGILEKNVSTFYFINTGKKYKHWLLLLDFYLITCLDTYKIPTLLPIERKRVLVGFGEACRVRMKRISFVWNLLGILWYHFLWVNTHW